MLINLSNHPFAKWTDRQKSVARENYGEIIDLPFPEIPPEWNSGQVRELAVRFHNRIIDLLPLPSTTDAVHLMGEQVFCYHLIGMLKTDGYLVVASTTTRISRMLPNGNIEKSFVFEQFRLY